MKNNRVPSFLPDSSCYLEFIGKVGVKNSAPVESMESKVSVLSKCGRFSSSWVCEEDESHKVAKTLDCNREWCEKCRDSAHGRRIARWLPKAQKIAEMGYLVVTFPHDERRPETKAEFSRIGRLITEALQRRGLERGFRRWHFFGEKEGVYHPHLNFLFEARFLSKEKLAEIKAVIREIINCENAVIYYKFSRSVSQIFHWIKYVSRPTFLEQKWNYELAEELYNFRNCVAWGKWLDEDKWGIPEEAERWDFLVKLEQKVCPVCGGRLIWCGVCHTEELAEKGYEQVYLNIWVCEADPRMVQTFKLLKSWTDGFGGLGSSRKQALIKHFEALNSYLYEKIPFPEKSPPSFL